MAKIRLTEAARLRHEADVGCASCRSVAEEDSIYCPSCRDYWTNDARHLVELDYEKDHTDEDAPAA